MINLEKVNLEKFQPHSLLENLPLHHTSNQSHEICKLVQS